MRLSLLALSLASLIGYARSWVFLRRVTMAPQLSGPVLFGNVRSAERDHSLGLGVSEMKIAGEDAGVDNVEIIPFKPWKKLIIALDSVPEQKQSYLLLPGKGALTQTVSWIALFGALAMVVKRLDFNGSTVATKLWQIVNNSKSRGTIMVILSSMASSCCYIQLALNAFSIGCAGLNSALGPMRPLFLALTAVAQVAIWRQSLEGAFGDAGHRLVSTAGVVALSLLPEILYYYQSARQWWKRTLLASYLQSGGATSRSSPTEFGYTRANVGEKENYVSFTLRTQGMGCVACTQKIQKIVDHFPFIVESSISIETGIVTVKTLGSSDQWLKEIKTLCVALSNQGYPSNIIRTKYYDWSLL